MSIHEFPLLKFCDENDLYEVPSAHLVHLADGREFILSNSDDELRAKLLAAGATVTRYDTLQA